MEAKVAPAEGKTHITINWGLGDPGDAPTGAVFEFLRRRSLGFMPVVGEPAGSHQLVLVGEPGLRPVPHGVVVH